MMQVRLLRRLDQIVIMEVGTCHVISQVQSEGAQTARECPKVVFVELCIVCYFYIRRV